MFNLEIKRFIDAAHRLPDSEDLTTKKCQNLHGHTYCIKVHVQAFQNEKHGMVVDFGSIKNIIDELDHTFINDIFEKSEVWSGEPTTAENIAKFYARRIEEKLSDYFVQVSVCEGYKGEENSNWVHYS